MLKPLLTLCILAGAMTRPCAADENEPAAGQEPQKIEVKVEQIVTSDSDGKPDEKVTGRIVVVGPEGEVTEYSLDDKLPEGVKVLVTPSIKQGDEQTSEHAAISFVYQTDDAEGEERLMVGVHCDVSDEVLRSQLRLGDTGLTVMEVIEDTPAKEAGIQKGDVIVSASGSDLKTVEQLVELVQGSEGNAITFSVLRAGEPVQVAVTPKKMPAPHQLILSRVGDVDLGDEHQQLQWLSRLDELEIPEEAKDALRKGRVAVRLHSLQPGIVIDRKMQSEEIQKLVEQARKQAAAQGALAIDAKAMAELHRQLAEKMKKSATAEVAQPVEEIRAEMKALQKQLEELQKKLAELSKPEQNEDQD